MRVLLLAGAWSPEASISLIGAESIKKALEEKGHSVTLCNPSSCFDSLISLAKQHDVSFINMHGSPGEDGLIQAMFEQSSCAFQGSSSTSSFLALHKAAAKQLYREAGILTADWHFLPEKPPKGWKPSFSFPLFIKSNRGGSSIGIAKVEKEEDLDFHIENLFVTCSELIVEPLIKGIELTCGVLDIKGKSTPLPPVLIKPKNDTFFDFKNKYDKDGAEEICPAPLPENIIEHIQETALKAHKVLGLSDYSRSDFILTKENILYILETNTLPGLTPTSLIPKEMAACGYSFADLVEILLENALLKKSL